ncbi:MAG: hypothetical protein ACJ765_04980 [Chloroflexota bacterium]
MNRRMLAAIGGVLAALIFSTSALAHECTNASKSTPAAGAQIVVGVNGDIIFATEGVLARVERGLIDPNTGEGFRGIIAFDLTGDGVADASTWFGVGPDGEIPLVAQFKGPACKGLTNIGIYLTQCVT